MDLTTRYLGLELSNPIVAGASPLATDLDAVKALGDDAKMYDIRSLKLVQGK